jgi:ribonuclease P protein component
MLAKINRLTKKTEFQNVYKNGKFFHSAPLSVNFIRNNSEKTKIGFSVGKNFSKKAVLRNQAKRTMREAVRKNIENIEKGFDIIISQKKPSPECYNSIYITKKINYVFSTINLTIKKQ